MSAAPHIVWFKRDLRVHDHAPLLGASQEGALVIPLYIVEPTYWQQPFASSRHWHFIHDCLTELSARLAQLGQPLIVRVGEACQVIKSLHDAHGAKTLWAHEETADLWTFERDKSVRRMCGALGITVHERPSNGVVRRLRNRDDWSRIRNERMSAPILPKPEYLPAVHACRSDRLPEKTDPLFGSHLAQTQTGGRKAAVADLSSFLNQRAQRYLQDISAPGASERSCSRVSAHLAWGSLSVREVVQALDKRRAQLSPMERKTFGRNLSAFGSRLAWRCHFVQKLEDQPSIETHCMHPAYEGLRDGGFDQARFDAWARGKTGYPFIDACMRSLIAAGWITFRMRAMLVSFASYQLWLDWRVTAPYLARLFTDYEPGIHYSQFQMQSGVTGINTMRVYNPIKQSQDQDPDAQFIRRWIPELRQHRMTTIHEPWQVGSSLFEARHLADETKYPDPIVDQSQSSRDAKNLIMAVRKSSNYQEQSQKVFLQHGSRKKKFTKNREASNTDQMDLFLLT